MQGLGGLGTSSLAPRDLGVPLSTKGPALGGSARAERHPLALQLLRSTEWLALGGNNLGEVQTGWILCHPQSPYITF